MPTKHPLKDTTHILQKNASFEDLKVYAVSSADRFRTFSINLDIKNFLNSQQRILQHTHAMYLAKSVHVAENYLQFFFHI